MKDFQRNRWAICPPSRQQSARAVQIQSYYLETHIKKCHTIWNHGLDLQVCVPDSIGRPGFRWHLRCICSFVGYEIPLVAISHVRLFTGYAWRANPPEGEAFCPSLWARPRSSKTCRRPFRFRCKFESGSDPVSRGRPERQHGQSCVGSCRHARHPVHDLFCVGRSAG